MVPSLPAHNLRNDGPQRQNEKLSNMSDLMFSPRRSLFRQGQFSISGIGQTASSQPGLLQQPVLSETVLTAPCDNQVIEQPNIEQRGRLGNFLRENLILLAGQGSTGRMVVNQDNLRASSSRARLMTNR